MSKPRARIRPPRKGLTVGTDADIPSVVRNICAIMSNALSYQELDFSFEALYRQVYKAVLTKQSDQLLEQLGIALRSDLITNINPPIVKLAINSQEKNHSLPQSDSASIRRASTDIPMLLNRSWGRYIIGTSLLSAIMTYVDRVGEHKKSVQQMLVDCFHEAILKAEVKHLDGETSSIGQVLTQKILENIARARDGDIIDHRLLKSSVGIFMGLFATGKDPEKGTLYISGFEEPFLESTTKFYRAERAVWRNHMSPSAYARQLHTRQQEELSRCQQFLSSATVVKVETLFRNLNDEETKIANS